MEQMYKIVTMALTIAVAFLVYDRFLKPASDKLLAKAPAPATGELQTLADVEKMLKEEAF